MDEPVGRKACKSVNMKVICYGDSNTFGYDPHSYIGGRYTADSRWVDILAEKTGWEVRNNGMSGREIPCHETVFAKSANLLIVMLGTNDLLQGNSVEQVAERMERFLNCLSIQKEKILLIAPPPMQRGDWVTDQGMIDASTALSKSYQELAERIDVKFADAGEWDISIAFDGVHLTEDGHKVFAQRLYNYLKETIK